MPIAGMTDKRVPQLPLVGALRKGGPKRKKTNKEGKEYEIFGEDLDHFRYTTRQAKSGEGMSPDELAFQQIYGERPVSIRVYLPYAGVDENFPTWVEWYKGGRLMARGDGKTAILWYDAAAKAYSHKEIPFPGDPKDRTESGTLYLILPDMWKAGHVGLIRLVTHSVHDIINIHAALSGYRHMAGGGLQGIVFLLTRYQSVVVDPDGVRRNKWLVGIQPDHVWAMGQLARGHQAAYAQLGDGSGSGDTSWDVADPDLDDTTVIDHDTGEIISSPPVANKQPVQSSPKATAAKEAPAPSASIPDALRRQFHQLGNILYADAWGRMRKIVVQAVTNKRETSSTKMTVKEMEAAITDFGKKMERFSNPHTGIGNLAGHVRKIVSLASNQKELADWLTESSYTAGDHSVKDVIEFLVSIDPSDPAQNNKDSVVNGINTIMSVVANNEDGDDVEF